jgi:hypothetical protein
MKNTGLLIVVIALLFFSSCTKNEVTSLTLDNSSLSITVGQIDSLVATITITGDLNKQPLTWTSSNTSVVTVEEGKTQSVSKNTYSVTARLTGLTIGTATITVKAGDKSIDCIVTVDDIYPKLTKAELWYWGDAYNTNSSNNFIIYLGSSGINMSDLTGYGEVMILELNTLLTATDSIPSGTYEMITDSLLVKNIKAYTLVPAYVNNKNQLWGCWYYGNTVNSITQGNIVVKRTGNIYNIDYELFDDYGVKISGNYNGNMTYVVGSTQTNSAVKRKSVNGKSTEFTRKSMNLKRLFE